MEENDVPDFFEERDLFGQPKPKLHFEGDKESINELNNETTAPKNKLLFTFKDSGGKTRRTKSFNYVLVVAYIALGIFAFWFKSWLIAIVLGIGYFIYLWVQSLWENSTFITRIYIDDKKVLVDYNEDDKQLSLSGGTDDFTFKKMGFNWNEPTYRMPHLAISNGIETVDQYLIGEWTQEKIELVINSFNEIKSGSDENV